MILDLCSQFSTETCSVPVLRWDFKIIIWLIETQSPRKPFTTLPRNFNYWGFTSVGFSAATLEPSRKFPSAEMRPTAGIPRESRDRVTRQWCGKGVNTSRRYCKWKFNYFFYIIARQLWWIRRWAGSRSVHKWFRDKCWQCWWLLATKPAKPKS